MSADTCGNHCAAAIIANRYITRTSRQVVVKARVFRHRRPGATAPHRRYLRREGVTRDRESARLFGPDTDHADPVEFVSRTENDRHHFRFIVSPEDAAEITELARFV